MVLTEREKLLRDIVYECIKNSPKKHLSIDQLEKMVRGRFDTNIPYRDEIVKAAWLTIDFYDVQLSKKLGFEIAQ